MNASSLPPIIFGTSGLGNIYEATSYNTKLAIVKECVAHAPGGIAVFDSAGKYGAGLALKSLGKCLAEIGVTEDEVIISNKLAWYQTPLTTPEPLFEPGVWKDLENDAVQKISYRGIIDCFEQGNELLGKYNSKMVSVHDPDEYLANAKSQHEKAFDDILDAFRALADLKKQDKSIAIGVGAKNWKTIQLITQHVDLDWLMIANSLTLKSHPKDLLDFVDQQNKKGVKVINSAVFNGGFLVGKDYFNYRFIDKTTEEGMELYSWREKFFALCEKFEIKPIEACFSFGFRAPGVSSIALSTTKAHQIKSNIEMVNKVIPAAFWDELVNEGLLEEKLFL